MSVYDMTFKIEILGELSASVLSNFYRFIEKNKIDFSNKDNIYVEKYYEILDLKRKMYFVDTIEELEEIQNQLLDYQKMIQSSNKRILFKFH